MSDFLVTLTLVTALGCALSAGALFAFSSFVIKALARLPDPQSIAAMQSINVQAVTPVFMTALFGTGLACLALAVLALADWDNLYSPYLLVGSGLYLLSVPGLAIAYHVPRNDALARVDPESADGARYWARYRSEWTRMNHARVAGGLAAAAVFALALHAG